jgi:predicted Zn-dependent protease
MQTYFYALADYIREQLHPNEMYLAYFSAEQTDFVRFNQAKIRQAGNVDQRRLSLDLIAGQRHVLSTVALSGHEYTDHQRLNNLLSQLRVKLSHLPEDPHLLYATEIYASESIGANTLPPSEQVVIDILNATQAYDCVGIYAAGGLFRGFANSFGQRNWHSRYSFNLDWSFYYNQDKAVKSAYAGFNWDGTLFHHKVTQASTQLALLKHAPHTLEPGRYRAYLSPKALHEILQLLCWNGFGLKAQRTRQSSLLRLLEEPRHYLHPAITLRENVAHGIAPAFQTEGFIKPEHITLIEHGVYQDALISPRSAKEYEVTTNGANTEESPTSLDLAAGDLAQDRVLSTLDTGLYINNLWYLNYSDRAACRMTGMTRFATFWVENGEIIAPLNVMRFDETLENLLGKHLLALTSEREFIMDNDTYEQRSTNSARLPGALIEDLTLTL